jgi:hypothetical protein
MAKNEALTFLMGSMVGFVGSVISTSIFEYAKLTLPSVGWSLSYWGSMFLFSTVVFFLLIKKTLIMLGINENLKSFDYAIVACVITGIIMISIGFLYVYNIIHSGLVFLFSRP